METRCSSIIVTEGLSSSQSSPPGVPVRVSARACCYSGGADGRVAAQRVRGSEDDIRVGVALNWKNERIVMCLVCLFDFQNDNERRDTTASHCIDIIIISRS